MQSVDGDAQLPNKKMKTLFFWNMSKSRRLTSTFFPISRRLPRLRPSICPSVGPSIQNDRFNRVETRNSCPACVWVYSVTCCFCSTPRDRTLTTMLKQLQTQEVCTPDRVIDGRTNELTFGHEIKWWMGEGTN